MCNTVSLMRWRSCWCKGLPVAMVLASRCSMVSRATLREAPRCCSAADREATGCSASGWGSVAAVTRSDQGVWWGLGGATERHRAGWGKAPQLHHRAEPLLATHPSTDPDTDADTSGDLPCCVSHQEQAHWNPSQQHVMSLWMQGAPDLGCCACPNPSHVAEDSIGCGSGQQQYLSLGIQVSTAGHSTPRGSEFKAGGPWSQCSSHWDGSLNLGPQPHFQAKVNL